MKVLKRLWEALKKEAEITKAQRRLARVPFDYMYLQTICETVSQGWDIEIEITTAAGDKMTIKKSSPQNQTNYKSFREKFTEYQNGNK